ncbi:MAG TPA: FAD-linked oxidase C-terminal domain-containing protein [Geminicoccaceae bacterium]|nr:FAD-linked oxidase C-terminal domain-containing protein [Geminicoccaceae bacterium]
MAVTLERRRLDAGPGDPALAARLRREIEGEVLFGGFDRGRYSTDASIYQIEPQGVVVPNTDADVQATLAIAREFGVGVVARGGGTSQAGQTVGSGLIIDYSKHLARVVELDAEGRTVWVEPGLVLDRLNRYLRSYGLFFPVDISTGSRATLGGMAANNACGARSIRYGIMVDNLLEIEALLADGETIRFAHVPGNLEPVGMSARYVELIQIVRALAEREADAIATGFPKVQRRVGGYNLDRVHAGGHSMAELLVGSEGTLALFRRLKLRLQALPEHRVLGVCHFPTFDQAMASTKAIVELAPSAVELVDRTILELGRQIPAYRVLIERFVRGAPDALLLVEFAGDDQDAQRARLQRLGELMADLGFADAVVEAIDPAAQAGIWDVRKAGLNIVMSMKGAGKPVSFIEDCAVPLEHLADYTRRLTEIFAKHGTTGTWYAHASVGCLHVRPILNLKQEKDAAAMRAIAEEAFAMVRAYKGSHSGEHGDGLVRSAWHSAMFGERLVHAFEEVKAAFDPDGMLNPGKIVGAPRMDDRRLFRYPPGYREVPLDTALDWSAWGGFLGAAEMCNNNGACRKSEPGVMCPSYRVTHDEQHVTRGRANTLRLALSGQLGPDALVSEAMADTLDLCVACKACRRECPTGVDMARMKIEVMHQVRRARRLSLRDRLIAYLPRYAPHASRARWLLHLRDQLPGGAAVAERALGFSAKRPLPRWHAKPFRPVPNGRSPEGDGRDVVLFADTFTSWFEPDNARAAVAVLEAAGYRVHAAMRPDGRPLCCGRTFLSAGLVAEARREAQATLAVLRRFVEAGVPAVGLEPSCLLTMRDEFTALLPGSAGDALAERALLLEEFLWREHAGGRLRLPMRSNGPRRALVHGHCHQKAFGAMAAVTGCLGLVPDLTVEAIESSCCGMAGAFGYEAEHHAISLRMAELSLLPAVRGADPDTLIVADGTSCRQQIRDGSGRDAVHVARVLADALNGPAPSPKALTQGFTSPDGARSNRTPASTNRDGNPDPGCARRASVRPASSFAPAAPSRSTCAL